MTVSVLVVDDQPLFCSGIRLLIEAQADLSFAGAAHTGESAVRLVEEVGPDVVLMDLRMPGGDGLAATRAIRTRRPGSRVLVLTTFRDRGVVQRALQAGAAGFVTKDATPAELLGAIRATSEERPVGAAARSTPMLPDPPCPIAPNSAAIAALTPREQEVFLHVARGLTNAQIASLSHISDVPRQVVGRVFSISKLGMSGRARPVWTSAGRFQAMASCGRTWL